MPRHPPYTLKSLTTITGRRRRRARAVSASDPGTRSTREPQAANTPTNFRSPQHGTAMGHTITSRESYPQLVAEKGARSTLGDTPDGKTITTVSLASDAGGDHLRLRDAGVRRRTTPIYSHTAVSDIAALLNREGDQRRPLTLNLIIHLSKTVSDSCPNPRCKNHDAKEASMSQQLWVDQESEPRRTRVSRSYYYVGRLIRVLRNSQLTFESR